ncbi:hypothetical protein ACPXCO_37435 [Streptomyces cyaneofuscatus]|uniref:hypothetical protein n=1 Tax=Streptomyces cyaneofuscatus TaxID=66883 RepID=UPI003CEDD300
MKTTLVGRSAPTALPVPYTSASWELDELRAAPCEHRRTPAFTQHTALSDRAER